MTDRNRWIALYVLCVGVLMIVLDATVVNVALPAIQEDLGFSQSSHAWVINAYLISFGGLLLLAGRLGDLISRRGIFLPGLGLIAAGLALFAQVPVDGDYVIDVLPSTILIGVGASLPALKTLAMSGATQSDAGLASGLVNTTAQVGAAVGLAVLATLSATRSEGLIEEGKFTAAALTGGYQPAFLIGAGLVVMAFVVAVTVLHPERQANEEIQLEAEPIDCEAA